MEKAFIEMQFPVSKVSKESYKERKAGSGQTLTGLGKWWGRKPLILVRSALLGLLMPVSDDPKKDMSIFLKILSMDAQGLRNRRTKSIAAKEVFEYLTVREREPYFGQKEGEWVAIWKTGITANEKALAIEKAWGRMSYDQKLTYCQRPEEYLNENPGVWAEINDHLGTNAKNLPELIQELGHTRFGRLPVVGDSFCGGGSVPFEAARMGCEVFACDLNPIAGLLTWANLNIAGADDRKIEALRDFQKKVYDAVDRQVHEWGIETNEAGDRANAYLYCIEANCPECGAVVPLAPSWVIGKGTNTVAILKESISATHATASSCCYFALEIKSNATSEEMKQAEETATVKNGSMFCPHCKKSIPITALRRDSLDRYGLRQWEKKEFIPREDDTFRERLYCIRYTHTGGKRYYTAPNSCDLEREQQVVRLLAERFDDWQEKAFIPCSEIEEGYNTSQLIRERGWKYWHQLFNPRQLLVHGLFMKCIEEMAVKRDEVVMGLLGMNRNTDWNSKLCRWDPSREDNGKQTFYNQALNTLCNWVNRASKGIYSSWFFSFSSVKFRECSSVIISDARTISQSCDLWITDPPYADAVNYHELSEFFLAWDKKLLQKAFPDWYTDSRRVLAVRGRDETFNSSMIEIYRNLAKNMPDNGMQIIMFTHQDVSVWADLTLIVWSAGLQVTAAWNIATETESGGLKEGNYVKGTVLLVLRKQTTQKTAFMDEIYPEIEDEVKMQIRSMHRLDDREEPNFSDADYILAAYAASLKVLTSYKKIEDIDVGYELSRTRKNGETSAIERIIESAKKIAYDQLIPTEFDTVLWKLLSAVERFYIKGLELEKNNIYQLSAYQELARGFGVTDYKDLLASSKANFVRLKTANEWGNRSLNSEGFGGSLLRNVLMALYLATSQKNTSGEEESIEAGRNWLRNEVKDYWNKRDMLCECLHFLSTFEPIANMNHWAKETACAVILKALVKNDGV